MWMKQKQRVDQLSALASKRERQMSLLQKRITTTCHQHLGTPGSLAWSFAAGAWWGAGRRSDERGRSNMPGMVSLFNVAIAAWKLIEQPPGPLNPPDV